MNFFKQDTACGFLQDSLVQWWFELTCPCMFMMTTVLERLHTTKCSGFLGSRMTLLTVMSVPADVPRGLKVLVHSVVFMFHTWGSNTVRWDTWIKIHSIHTGRLIPLRYLLRSCETSYFCSCFSHLDCTVWGSADDVVAVWSEGGFVHKWGVTTELLKSFTWLQSMDS